MIKQTILLASLMAITTGANAQLQCVDTNHTVMVTQKWGDTQRKYSRNYGHIGDNDALIVKVLVPTTVIPSSKTLYSMNGAEWLDGNTLRYFNVSNRPCDFGTSLVGSSFGTYFAINNTPVIKKYSWWYKAPVPTFKSGETIYFNLKNSPGCYPTCNVFWQFSWR